MSGIYIPMEMPKDIEPGLVIEFADGIDGKRYARLYHYRHSGLTEWLELIPVPPHGRLGDLDALCERLRSLAENEYTPEVFANWIENHIDAIIPASEEET